MHFFYNFHLHSLVTFLEHASYAGIFLVSLLGGYFLPAPEAVLLMLIGFVAGKNVVGLGTVLALTTVGGILGDNLVFWLSINGSKLVNRFMHKVRKSKLIEYEHLVADNIGKTIFFLRFVVGVRFFAPVVAGIVEANWKRFFFFDAVANFLNALLFVLLGFFFQKHIIFALTAVEIAKNVLLLLSAVIASVLVGFFWKKEQTKK